MLAELEKFQDGQLDSAARGVIGRYLLANLVDFEIPEPGEFRYIFQLRDRLHPQIRASFIGNYCDHLTQLARYSEA